MVTCNDCSQKATKINRCESGIISAYCQYHAVEHELSDLIACNGSEEQIAKLREKANKLVFKWQMKEYTS
jgi:hypothetical protein